MKILMTHDQYSSYVSGSVFFIRRLAKGLIERGHEILILAPSLDDKESYSDQDGISIVGIPSVPFFGWKENRMVPTTASNKNKVRRHILAFAPDVIHIQGHIFLPRMVVGVAQELGIPVMATSHFMAENIIHHSPVPPILPVRKAIEWWSYRRRGKVLNKVFLITSPTRTSAELLKKTSRLDREVYPVSCGIDLQTFYPGQGNASLKQRYALPDRPIALYVGRFEKEKNIDQVLRAAALTIPKKPFSLVLVGQGVEEARLRSLAHRLNIQEYVYFIGFVPDSDLPALYCIADFFVTASTAELQSIATMEAMASGLPVLAANAVALPELVESGVNGFLFEPGDLEQLAEHMEVLLKNPQLRSQFSKNGLQKIAQHDLARTVDSFERIYHLVQTSPKPKPSLSGLPLYISSTLSLLFMGVGAFLLYLSQNGESVRAFLYHALVQNPGSRMVLFALNLLKEITIETLALLGSFSFVFSFFLIAFTFFWFQKNRNFTGNS